MAASRETVISEELDNEATAVEMLSDAQEDAAFEEPDLEVAGSWADAFDLDGGWDINDLSNDPDGEVPPRGIEVEESGQYKMDFEAYEDVDVPAHPEARQAGDGGVRTQGRPEEAVVADQVPVGNVNVDMNRVFPQGEPRKVPTGAKAGMKAPAPSQGGKAPRKRTVGMDDVMEPVQGERAREREQGEPAHAKESAKRAKPTRAEVAARVGRAQHASRDKVEAAVEQTVEKKRKGSPKRKAQRSQQVGGELEPAVEAVPAGGDRVGPDHGASLSGQPTAGNYRYTPTERQNMFRLNLRYAEELARSGESRGARRVRSDMLKAMVVNGAYSSPHLLGKVKGALSGIGQYRKYKKEARAQARRDRAFGYVDGMLSRYEGMAARAEALSSEPGGARGGIVAKARAVKDVLADKVKGKIADMAAAVEASVSASTADAAELRREASAPVADGSGQQAGPSPHQPAGGGVPMYSADYVAGMRDAFNSVLSRVAEQRGVTPGQVEAMKDIVGGGRPVSYDEYMASEVTVDNVEEMMTGRSHSNELGMG